MSELAVRESDLPVILDEAERALALIGEVEDAELLFRKLKAVDKAARLAEVGADLRLQAGRLHLRAERRWGELLGEAEHGGDRRSDQVTNSHLKSSEIAVRRRARSLAFDVERDVFEDYLRRVNDPETLRRARIFRLQREREAKRRRAETIEPVWRSGEIEIRHGDFRAVLDDLFFKVDVIVTDPPYEQEFLEEWSALSEVAAHLLTREGTLVVMAGQSWLPEYVSRLTNWLTYRWCGAYLMDGAAARVHGRKVGTKWKPILILDKGEGRQFLTQDVFTSSGQDKAHHDWGQTESGIAELVERFSKPGDLVVDPFLGGGTTAVVCRELGRRFVGCDVDAAAITAARERLCP